MSLPERALQRRLVTVPAIVIAAPLLTLAIPLWLPVALVVDAFRLRFRCPIARLLAFCVCWLWLEVAGVGGGFALWAVGRSRHAETHFRLQRWWAKRLVGALRWTCGIDVQAEGLDAFDPGPVLLFVRHASLADALTSAYVVTSLAGLHPRYVLKRELLADPCLDVVGQRIPNYFLDRGAGDSAPELAAVQRLVEDMGAKDVGIIFPEGTRANTRKREAALARIAERDPDRAKRLSGLQHMLPPRPSGARAMVQGAPNTDVVFAWHVGFEGLDTFAGILRALGRGIAPIRFVARRVSHHEMPIGEGFTAWLDEQWLRMDAEVGAALSARNERTR